MLKYRSEFSPRDSDILNAKITAISFIQSHMNEGQNWKCLAMVLDIEDCNPVAQSVITYKDLYSKSSLLHPKSLGLGLQLEMSRYDLMQDIGKRPPVAQNAIKCYHI